MNKTTKEHEAKNNSCMPQWDILTYKSICLKMHSDEMWLELYTLTWNEKADNIMKWNAASHVQHKRVNN